MDITITPSSLRGTIQAIPSKSMAHRLLILSAFAREDTVLICPETNQDMDATARCLTALGAGIRRTGDGYHVSPVTILPTEAVLPCGESGSTLRFLLPVVGALGVDATFQLEGRLPQRPLSPLWEEMERMGCKLSRPTGNTVRCCGKLRPGRFTIPGNVSSQYITGLLLAAPLMDGVLQLDITGKVESKPYIDMTRDAIARFPERHSPGSVTVEGDWSNAAFFLGASVLGSDVRVENLNPESLQGDRAVSRLLPLLEEKCTICAADIPDLVPILSVVAAAKEGAVFTDIGRLRIKESDRVASTIAMVRSLGGRAEATEDTLVIHGTGLTGGCVDSFRDHRIAMSAAIASTVCTAPVTILDAEAVNKSYPTFWDTFTRLGGKYEQHLR